MGFDLTDLEKLEALHAAATQGKWTGDRHDGTVKYRLHSENCECDREEPWVCPHLILSVDHKNVTSGFLGMHGEANEKLVMALHNAFPDMAKALREAWAERNEAIEARAAAGYSAVEFLKLSRQLEKERDEARAEVERLKAVEYR